MPTHVSPIIFERTKSYFEKLIKTKKALLKNTSYGRLKIAIVTETWPPEINGVALSILQLVKGLQKRGHKILLVRPEQKQQTNDFIADLECLVKAQSIPKYNQLQFGLPQVFKIGSAFDQFKPDIVHIVTEGPLGLAAMNQAKNRQLPISSGFHSSFHDFSRYFDLAFLVRPLRQYLKWFHNNTDLTCVPSKDTAQVLQEFGICCPIQVIGRGVDSQRFHPEYRNMNLRQQWQADEHTTVLLSVGRISPEKDLNVIFQNYRLLKQRQPQRKLVLVVVGHGPMLDEYQQQYPDVVFMGAQMGEALSQCYASADVFVFPSRVETFGNVVLEAMASGLPVLAYDYACAGQILQHEQTGWLIPLVDRECWRQQLLNLPELEKLKYMGKNASNSVADRGWDKPVQDFEQALMRYAKRSIRYLKV